MADATTDITHRRSVMNCVQCAMMSANRGQDERHLARCLLALYKQEFGWLLLCDNNSVYGEPWAWVPDVSHRSLHSGWECVRGCFFTGMRMHQPEVAKTFQAYL